MAGREPVRERLQRLDPAEQQAIETDFLRAQWRWPVGMPPCRPMCHGPWEIRTDWPTKRAARVLLCHVTPHGFITDTPTTPEADLAAARHRQKQLER